MQVTEGQILVRAREILTATAAKCPQYADKLGRIRFEVSRRLTRCAGRAIYRTNTVQLSHAFFADQGNFEKEFFETVTHELAHLVVGVLNRGNKPHGPLFRLTHRAMGGTGKRCHTMALADGYTSRARAKRVQAVCGRCGQPMDLGPTQAKRHAEHVARGGKGYSHRVCPR